MDIVEEIRQNPESGARRLAAEYKAGLMTLARRFCNDPGDAEELVNATFAAVVENIESHLEQASFFGWMCQILTSLHSRNVRRKSHGDIVYPGVVPDAIDEKAQQEIYDNLDHSLVREAIGKLTKEERDLLILHYFMDMPVSQMAKLLALPSGTVMSKLYYARKALATKLGVKAHEAVKKPGVKATLLALALCALTAAGAAVTAAVHGGAQDTGRRGSERAVAEGPRSVAAANGETGETSETGGYSPIAPVPTPVSPDSPVPPVPTSSLSSGEPTMNTTLRTIAASAAFAAAGAASTASGGLLYEPSNYAAQGNLVLHLDGIRNAGALKAHDASATSWADLSPDGRSANLQTITAAPANTLAVGTSAWTDDGFYFNGLNFFQMSSTLTLGNTYTIQVVCDVDTDTFQNRFTQSAGLVSEGNLQWPCFVGTTDYNSGDNCNIYYNCGSGEQRVNIKANNVNYKVYVAKSGWTGHYLTAWANGSKASLFATDSVGTQANFNQNVGTRTLTFGTSYGSTTYGKWRRGLVGTIKAIRIYDKALSDDELAANRVIDEARFFTGIPVTNVVVATAVEGLEGNEASGAYALDAGGYTFSAPATASTPAGTYSCTGYTIERWDGSDGGTPVLHSGETSSTLADTSALVRLTWQWEQTSAFVDYTWMASPADADWNTSSLNWNSGVAWVNGNNAIFPATSSQKTIAASGTPVANNVTFNGSGYRIDGSLKVDGRLTANADCTIANCLAGDGVVLGGNSTVHMGSSGSPSLKTLTLEDSVTVNANNRQCFGPDPVSFSTNIVVGGTAPTLRINSGSVDLGANRFVRITSQGLNLGANAPLTFTLRSFAADGPASGEFSGDTFVKILKDYNGTVALSPAVGASNAIGRIQNYGDLTVRGGTVCIGSATANGTGDNALMHVKGTNTVFSTRGRLTVDGGTLHSAQSTRYVDVNSYGQVIVTNRGRIHMPGVHWLNGHSTPGRLVVADGEFIIGTLRVSQSGGNESTVLLDEGGFMAASTLRMDNNSKGTFTFDGGTFQATGSGALFDGADDKWANVVFAVGTKGAVFDCSNGKGMTWVQPLVSGVAAGDVDGGVTVLGADPEVGIEFSGAATNNSYTGLTVVSNAVVKYAQTCALSGTYDFLGDATGCGCLAVAAGQDISGITLKASGIEAFSTEANTRLYKVLDAPDGYVGKFALASDFPKGKWDVRYDTDAAYLSPVKAFVIVLK